MSAANESTFRDFSENLNKTNTRFMSACLISIALSELVIKEDSKILGFSFKNLISFESKIEVVAFLIVVSYGINLLFRILEERESLSKIDSQFRELKVSASDQVNSLTAEMKTFRNTLDNFEQDAKTRIRNVQQLNHRMDEIIRQKKAGYDAGEIAFEGQDSWEDFCQSHKDQKEEFEANKKDIDGFTSEKKTSLDLIREALDKVNVQITNQKNFFLWTKLRIQVFTVILPAFMFIACCYFIICRSQFSESLW